MVIKFKSIHDFWTLRQKFDTGNYQSNGETTITFFQPQTAEFLEAASKLEAEILQ